MRTTKEKLLSILESSADRFFSGEELAKCLSVSRTAIWKAVNSLRNDGYDIDGAQNKGYRLSPDTDVLSENGIKKYLHQNALNIEFEVLQETDSTNALLRARAATCREEGYTVIAASQTNGRGRLGRSFYSPSDTGIYMSILLRPSDISVDEAVKITTIAAVAACEAIETVSPHIPQIKWVNDIFINGKKVSGILTEASFNMENGSLDYIILGIGINVYTPKENFPTEIENIAGSIFEKRSRDIKNRLVGEFINKFASYYKNIENSGYAQKYRDRCFVIGKEINVISQSGQKSATAIDVDDACRLIVRYPDGTTEKLSTGEISVRVKE